MTAILDGLGTVFTPYAWLGHILMGLGIQIAIGLPLHLALVGEPGGLRRPSRWASGGDERKSIMSSR